MLGKSQEVPTAHEAPTGSRPAMPAPARSGADGPGAVVIGGDYQGLGIVRSLGQRGVPVVVVDDELSISRFSRYAVESVRVSDLRDETRAVETLLEVGHTLRLEGWVLYPTREETVAALSRNHSTLSRLYRVPTAAWNAVNYAWDKRNTYRLAEQLGVAAPRTWYPASKSELQGIEGDPPWVIKPAIKEHFLYETKAKAWRANNRQELAELYQKAAEVVGPAEVMVQEFIPGDGRQQFAYCAFFKDGDAIASMCVRRARQHPPEFGRASTFVETVELPELERLSKTFLGAIDYYGLVEVEYKLDPRDERLKILDVNPRTWGYHSVGSGAGVDFPYLLFADQMGESVNQSRARPGVRWARLVTDLPTGLLQIARGRLSWRAYLRSLTDIDVEAVLSWRDPLPGLVELVLIPYLFFRRGF